MKVCPKCGSTTTDDTQSFCLMDGIQLIAGESQPTVVMPTPTSTQPTVTTVVRKRRTGLWVALVAVILLFGGAALAGLLYYVYRLGNQAAIANRNSAANSTPLTRPPTPRPSSPTTPATSPAASGTASPADDPLVPGSDDVTPITWTVSASTFRLAPGLTYTFLCPAEGTLGTVWGSDPYTADSSICTAAVHAGKITVEKGGEVTIEIRGGRSTYGATTRNGVTTYPYGQYPHSVVFIDGPTAGN